MVGHPQSESSKKKISNSLLGITRSEETKLKMSLIKRGKKFTLTHRERISESKKGKNHPNFGKHRSEITKEKIRLSKIGIPRPKSMCIKISASLRGKYSGELSSAWKGGISFEPYCVKFNDEFKERVRSFFGHICVECGSPQNGRKLDVHHVNFNKNSCCDHSLPLFVTLCRHCHAKTQYDRVYWEQHFTEIINRDYGGKCYIPKVGGA